MAATETRLLENASRNELERIETLLALDQEFGQPESASAPSWAKWSSLSADDRRLLEQCSDRYTRLPASEQARWLAGALSRLRGGTFRQLRGIGEQIHPSHVAEVLRGEPPRIRRLVLRNLPPAMAASAAARLGLDLELRAGPGTGGRAAAENIDRIEVVVRHHFLSRFVYAESLRRLTSLDRLSISQVSRLARLLGIRETAMACCNVTSPDSLAAFLRRFALEDCHAIMRQLPRLRSMAPPDREYGLDSPQVSRSRLRAQSPA